MKTETEKITVPRFINIFKKFSPSEKIRIAEQIDQETFTGRWELLDAELPDVEMSDEEIMDEVRAVRSRPAQLRRPSPVDLFMISVPQYWQAVFCDRSQVERNKFRDQ